MDALTKRDSKGRNLTERIRSILQSYLQFPSMCSNQFHPENTSWTSYGSLEDARNAVHIYVGGYMGDAAVAAFDPVFWFHHCNIDRFFAIWQALHDDKSLKLSYVVPSYEYQSTRVIAVGARTDIETPLAPFTRSETKGDFYNSQHVRSTKTLGYVYPETQDWLVGGTDGVRAAVNKLYAGASFSDVVREKGSAFEKMTAQLSKRAKLHQEVAAVTQENISWTVHAFQAQEAQATLPEPVLAKVEAIRAEPAPEVKFEKLVEGNKYLEWLVDVRAQKHANDGDFVVHFFLGSPEDDHPEHYVHTPNHVASFSTFGQSRTTGCDKCQSDQAEQLLVTGQIPLTLALVERHVAGEQVGLDVQSVEQYLTRNLHWRVTTRNGQRIGRASIDALLVGVVTNQVTLPDDHDELPSYAPTVVPRPAATTNANGDGGRGRNTGFTG